MADFVINKELYSKYCNQPNVLGDKARLKLDKSYQLYEEAKNCVPGGVSGARSPMNFILGEYPVFIESGKGSHVWDVDGNEYIDFLAGYGPTTLGWAIPEIDAAAKKAIDNGSCFSLAHYSQIRLANKIKEYFKCAERVLLCKTGTDTTVAAVRMARAYTGKEKILTDGYHGWGDFSQYGEDGGVLRSTKESTVRIPYGDAETYEKELKKGNVAAVMITPYPAAPMCVAETDVEFLKKIRELTNLYDVPLLYDEIRTAFRFAMGGISELVGVEPDVVCIAKAFANGYSIAAIGGKAEILNTIAIGGKKNGTMISSTYFPNNLEMDVALKTIEFYEKNDVIGAIREKGEYYLNGIKAVIAKHDAPMVCYGEPAMPAFMFDINSMDEETLMARTMTLFTYMVRSGLIIQPFRQQYITYSHSKEDLDKALSALDKGLGVVRELYKW
jgi:glutamate-1-semialdehyde aminotransferase